MNKQKKNQFKKKIKIAKIMETDENLRSQLQQILENPFNNVCFECGIKIM